MQELLFRESAAEREASAQGAKLSHLERLRDRLGDGRDWDFTGEVTELPHATGTCSCGHSGLKFLFLLRNRKTADTAIVGSTCIEHYAEANPDMVKGIRAAVDQIEAQAAEQKRKARELAQEAEVQALLAECREVTQQLCRIVAEGAERSTCRDYFGNEQVCYRQTKRVNSELYRARFEPSACAMRLESWVDCRWRQYKSKAAFKTAIRKEIAEVKRLLAVRPVFTGPMWR